MKTALAALGIALSLLATPAQASTYGPDSGVAGTPTYTLPILVIDTVMGTLSHTNRPLWREARDKALAMWGLPFEVRRQPESSLAYPWTDENINAGLAITDIIPNAILLVRMRSVFNQECAGWVETEQGGIVAYSPWAPLWRDASQNAGVIAHEIGHTLGFGHGGAGVMSGGDRVNAEELALAQTYYG